MKSATKQVLLPIDGILNSDKLSYRGLNKLLVHAVRTGASTEGLACDEAILLAVELAVLDPKATEDQKRDIFILAAALQIARENGSTCVELSYASGVQALISLAQRHLTGPIALPDAAKVTAHLRDIVANETSPLIGTPDRQCPITVNGDYAYIGRHYHFENSVAERLHKLAALSVKAGSVKKAEKLLNDITQMARISEDGVPKELSSFNDEQTKAVLDAVTHGLTVITGGPGTGKTSIVVAILRLLVRLGVGAEEIAVATLTGRAAFRLQETITGTMAAVAPKGAGAAKPNAHDAAILEMMTNNGPRTIHRLLSASADGSSFRNNKRSRIRQKWVIIDESSMIDLDLAYRLCEALPDDAHLILLGDANQLPPVGSGAPFRDLVNSASGTKAPGFALTQLKLSYRASEKDAGGRNIIGVAAKVTGGETSTLLSSSGAGGETINIASLDSMPPDTKTHLLPIAKPHDLGQFLTRWYSKHYSRVQDYVSDPFVQSDGKFDAKSQERLRKLLQAFANAKILCLSKDGQSGVHAINRHMRNYQKDHYKLKDSVWYVGEPVIAVKNDYHLQIFNGDLGVIVSVAADGLDPRPMAVFERSDGFFAVNLGRIGSNMTLAYAVTVHKAQGGETKHVALMLPDTDDNLNSRPLIYTAITRASDSVVIVGSPDILTAGVNRDVQRLTRLGSKL